MKDPLFPSFEKLERQLKAAKQLRADFVLGLAVTATRKFAIQSRRLRTLETSVVVALCAIATFWLAMLSSPNITEADQSRMSSSSLK
jgi:hypothetical protein